MLRGSVGASGKQEDHVNLWWQVTRGAAGEDAVCCASALQSRLIASEPTREAGVVGVTAAHEAVVQRSAPPDSAFFTQVRRRVKDRAHEDGSTSPATPLDHRWRVMMGA